MGYRHRFGAMAAVRSMNASNARMIPKKNAFPHRSMKSARHRKPSWIEVQVHSPGADGMKFAWSLP